MVFRLGVVLLLVLTGARLGESSRVYIRLDRQSPQHRRVDAPRDAVAHQHDPHRPRRGRSLCDDRVHSLRDPHVPLSALPQRQVHLQLEHVRAVPLELRPGVSHDLDLPDRHARGLAVHRGRTSSKESRVVQRQAHLAHDRPGVSVLPVAMHTALHRDRGEAADGTIGQAREHREHDEGLDGELNGQRDREKLHGVLRAGRRVQHHAVLCEAQHVDGRRSQGYQLLDL